MSVRNRICIGLLAVVLLAGCSSKPSNAGAAAVIGQTKITQQSVTTQLEETLSEIAKSAGSGQAPTASALGQMIVNRLILTELMNQAMSKLKLTVPESKVTQMQSALNGQYGQQNVESQLLMTQGIASNQIRDYLRLYLNNVELGKALAPTAGEQQQSAAAFRYLSTLANEEGVTVSPRYGSWDATQLNVAGTDNSLSGLAPSK